MSFFSGTINLRACYLSSVSRRICVKWVWCDAFFINFQILISFFCSTLNVEIQLQSKNNLWKPIQNIFIMNDAILRLGIIFICICWQETTIEETQLFISFELCIFGEKINMTYVEIISSARVNYLSWLTSLLSLWVVNQFIVTFTLSYVYLVKK